jgi:hypothetical protein
MKTEQEIQMAVESFINNRPHIQLGANPEELNHIKNMCESILMTKHNVGYDGGGFVQAVVNNDLMGSFGRADSINKKYIGLYAELLYNY